MRSILIPSGTLQEDLVRDFPLTCVLLYCYVCVVTNSSTRWVWHKEISTHAKNVTWYECRFDCSLVQTFSWSLARSDKLQIRTPHQEFTTPPPVSFSEMYKNIHAIIHSNLHGNRIYSVKHAISASISPSLPWYTYTHAHSLIMSHKKYRLKSQKLAWIIS